MKIDRREAIELICSRDLGRLTQEERAEQLEVMSLEAWDSHPEWASLPEVVRDELEAGTPIADPGAGLYDPVLKLWLRGKHAATTNEFLLRELSALDERYTEVVGEVVERTPCPCCGLKTLSSRGATKSAASVGGKTTARTTTAPTRSLAGRTPP